MKILITGGGGFVGRYVIAEFTSRGYEVAATVIKGETPPEMAAVYCIDLLDAESIARTLEAVQPDVILHLAAQSSVALSWQKPQLTCDINIKGTVNLLEEVRRLEISPRIILAGSSEEYGKMPVGAVSEETKCAPQNIYAVTKTAQNMIGDIYFKAYGMDIIRTRAFNHIGPYQSEIFVAADFAKQIALIEAGQREAVIRTGNLAAKRDFLDVRDVAAAYGDIAEKGKRGRTYNIGSGRAVAISDLLSKLMALSDCHIKNETDKSRFRPVDVPETRADISLIREDTGWYPKIDLDETLKNVLDYWRAKVSREEAE